MIEKICNINGIPVYSDPYMKDNEILKGRKQGISGSFFMIANPKTANILYKTTIEYKRKLRREKLEKISGTQET
jgi:hypothetical protein